jgi:8-oxo-dGTP pyrophosphatase MutT (NUDIX family)
MSGNRVKRRLAEYRLANYRPGVGILLLSRDGLAFVGHRIIMPAGLARWQMPQGGIDTGEAPRLAALRELKEEIGTDAVSFNGDMTLWDFEKVMRVTRRGIGRTSVHHPKAACDRR